VLLGSTPSPVFLVCFLGPKMLKAARKSLAKKERGGGGGVLE